MTEETLLEFPCQFPIKVMGKSNLSFDLLVTDIVRRHVPELHDRAVTTRASKNANYVAVTILIEATSKAQLDAIYLDLTSHPNVLMAL